MVTPVAPTPSGTQGILYTANVAGLTRLLFQNATNTYTLSAQASASNPGYVYLTNGNNPMILQFGEVTNLATGEQGPFSFAINFPNNLFTIQVTEVQASTSKVNNIKVKVEPAGPPFTAFSLEVISVSGSFTNTKAYWFAVGN